jgi:hypothetical protein
MRRVSDVGLSQPVAKKPTRGLIVLMALAGVSLFLSALSYLVLSTPAHYAKAAAILDNPNGNFLWVEEWRWNRQAALVCGAFSAAVFAISYFRLWCSQRQNLDSAAAAMLPNEFQ